MNTRVFITAAVVALIGFLIILYKILFLGFPLKPDARSGIWSIEAHVSFIAEGEPVKALLKIPTQGDGFSLLHENFIGRGYGLTTTQNGPNRVATWTIDRAIGEQHLYYRSIISPIDYEPQIVEPSGISDENLELSEAELAASKAFLIDINKQAADSESFIVQVLQSINNYEKDRNLELLLGPSATPKRIAHVLNNIFKVDKKVPSRIVSGLELVSDQRSADLVYWLEFFYDGKWNPYLLSGKRLKEDHRFFPWWKGEDPAFTFSGGRREDISFSVTKVESSAMSDVITRTQKTNPLFVRFSLFNLPVETQSVYKVILMLPIGALIVVIFRNLIGLKTFGTFMPVLVALSFRETNLLWGIVLFSSIVMVGLGVRFLLEKLKLLAVPRLSAVICVVVLMMSLFSLLLHLLEIDQGLSVALFPMVILTMTIERMSIIWEEVGSSEAIKTGLGSLFVSSVIFQVISIESLKFFVFVFPEILLIVLALNLIIGRYTGYRLLELRRFNPLAESLSKTKN